MNFFLNIVCTVRITALTIHSVMLFSTKAKAIERVSIRKY